MFHRTGVVNQDYFCQQGIGRPDDDEDDDDDKDYDQDNDDDDQDYDDGHDDEDVAWQWHCQTEAVCQKLSEDFFIPNVRDL